MPETEWFQTCMDDIAHDWRQAPPETEPEQYALFASLADSTFLKTKGTHVKMMRRFTLFAALVELSPEWTIQREAYAYYHRMTGRRTLVP